MSILYQRNFEITVNTYLLVADSIVKGLRYPGSAPTLRTVKEPIENHFSHGKVLPITPKSGGVEEQRWGKWDFRRYLLCLKKLGEIFYFNMELQR